MYFKSISTLWDKSAYVPHTRDSNLPYLNGFHVVEPITSDHRPLPGRIWSHDWNENFEGYLDALWRQKRRNT